MLRQLKAINKLNQKAFLLAVVILAGLATLSFTGLALADQPDPAKVLTVDNPNVSCESPVAGPKVEGGLGRTIVVSAQDPIDFVTVKSGGGAVVVSAQFDTNQGQITLSKDVSGYVVWTCPAPTTTTSPPSTTLPAPTSTTAESTSTTAHEPSTTLVTPTSTTSTPSTVG
jgi:hypothetical protein